MLQYRSYDPAGPLLVTSPRGHAGPERRRAR